MDLVFPSVPPICYFPVRVLDLSASWNCPCPGFFLYLDLSVAGICLCTWFSPSPGNLVFSLSVMWVTSPSVTSICPSPVCFCLYVPDLDLSLPTKCLFVCVLYLPVPESFLACPGFVYPKKTFEKEESGAAEEVKSNQEVKVSETSNEQRELALWKSKNWRSVGPSNSIFLE